MIAVSDHSFFFVVWDDEQSGGYTDIASRGYADFGLEVLLE
eukprot:CAMPEP_0114578024 /NCGR_PEP_ID=MMETSP0125-20121206/2612_1 /TAXON_ID=485358 ORGANISM="Aristerostoma sp., Strain ATCC 50986" /NCGR_SAMPLE_ID=MMETSP0125 /ASSEMBLY_ACC=CAM_ASM_000245 /LENGTH=40 /DNA_ID= /DNA_START= /DNA_END= /DNA_ORIENTATION=